METELNLSLTAGDYSTDSVQETGRDLFWFIKINIINAAVYDKHSIELLLY